MPASSWFHKLRRRKKDNYQRSSAFPAQGALDEQRSQECCEPPQASQGAAGYSPNRASYYFPSADRARRDGGLRCIAPRGDDEEDDGGSALDVRVDVVHRRAGGRLGGVDAPPTTPELNLRRIITTRPAPAKNETPDNVLPCSSGSGSTTSAATTPSTFGRGRGFHVKPAGRRRRLRPRRDHDDKEKEKAVGSTRGRTMTMRRRWLYESLVVVKTSSDPEREMAESMAEMVAANHIRSSEDLEELLACYLALNAAEHHRAVVAAFRCVWLHIMATQRLHHH
ncbi:transcription repressor OFP1 [Brachypodium distachyon]|uniref:Transcription repressor n=1 Tax=Brachypodium distachyon TaxID=15368 RepID=I1H5Q6_BRADI|nr:transcription repressor OFP1 [Brachypodium distachyon]KQK21789.1 hypothetical protein BRADI_1g63120v3 [Brachypodium distachyon]|eukprot:XP_003561662.1 transcription repressor OFP1 [Brachypodium distachyon]